MQIQYLPLLKLRLQHDYFPDGNCPTVELIPAEHTRASMQQLGIRMVRRDFGVEFYYNNGSNNAGGLLHEAEQYVIALSFLLRPVDSLFYNYTLLSNANSQSKTTYFSNLDGALSASFSELPSLDLQPSVFNFGLDQPASTLTIKDELDNLLYAYDSDEDTTAENFHPIIPQNEEYTKYQINLSRITVGKFTVTPDERTPVSYLQKPGTWKAGDLGIVNLFLGDTGGQGVHIINNGNVTPAEYTIAFSARPTIWRYNIIDRPGNHRDFKLLKAVDESVVAKVGDTPVLRELQDGTKAVVLENTETLPLRQRPGLVFQLTALAVGNNREVTIPLPSASAEQLNLKIPEVAAADPPSSGKEDQDLEDLVFYSDMYVYI